MQMKTAARNIIYGLGITALTLAPPFNATKAAGRTAEQQFSSRSSIAQLTKTTAFNRTFEKRNCLFVESKCALADSVSGGVQYNDRTIHLVYDNGKEVKETIIDGMGLEAFGPDFMFNYTWRTKGMVVPNVDISTSKVHIQGEALVMVGTGREGIFILFADKDLNQFVMATMKQSLVIKGDWEQRYHMQEEGISDPVVLSMNEHGVAWPNRMEDGRYEVHYVPLPTPKLITFSTSAAGSTTDWIIDSDGQTVQLKDSKDVLASATIKDNVGDNFIRKDSRIKWNGVPRNADLDLRIENEGSSVSLGKYFAIDVKPEIVAGKFETVEMGEGRKPTYKVGTVDANDSTFLVRPVPTRDGIWDVYVPQNGIGARIFQVEEGAVLNNSEIDRVLDLVVASDNLSGMAGWIRGNPKSDANYVVVAHYPSFGLEVAVDQLRKLSGADIRVKGNRVTVYENGEAVGYTGISDLKVYSSTGQ